MDGRGLECFLRQLRERRPPKTKPAGLAYGGTGIFGSLTFGTEEGFALSMYRMRDLATQSGIPSNESLGEWQEGDPDPVEILSRDHAGIVLKQIEDFFRQREPASPIPILLFKARNFLTKDFHSLVRELLPPSS